MCCRRLSLLAAALSLLALPAHVRAADPDSKESSVVVNSASQIVAAALRSEAEGDLVARDRLLNQAAMADSQCAAAQWHRGLIKTERGTWQSVEDCFSAKDAGGELATYEARRDVAPDSVLGQWELAAWCLDNGYDQQGRAHLQRLLELSPDHAGARRLLGFRNMGGDWVSTTQVEQLSKRVENVRIGLVKYGKPLSQLAREFNSRHLQVRADARHKLNEIQDPLAIAPIEAILGTASVEAAQAAVGCLSTIADPEASLALARFAMFHPQAKVKLAALDRIKTRPYHDYVPSALDLLSAPVVSMAIPVVGPNGTLTGFRQSFIQERLGKTDILVLDTRLDYSDGAVPRGRGRARIETPPTDLLSQREAFERSAERAAENNAAVQVNNERIAVRNRLIVSFLSDVTEREFNQPADVWKWWDETNETEYQSLKPSNIKYATSALSTRNYTEMAAAATSAAMGLSGTRVAGECFARGTPIVTRKGLRAIETLRVGDRVLSRDVASGELSWKAVVRTTTRPPRPVYEISVDNEKFSCTGGHLFWVSGQGWVKASQLRPGDILHSAGQPIVVMKIDPKPEQPTFNLAIDRTQTYFVGQQMILSHDVTDRVPTYIKVPGLQPTVVD